MHREPGKAARGVSRRRFIRQAAASAGAVAAGSAASEGDQSPQQNISRDTARTSSTTAPLSSSPPTIRVPEELITGSKAPVVEIQFPMTGAQVFARACKEEGVAALFCCPGNYGVIHAIANIGIPTFSGRHEGAMTHAADAFIRVSGELAVASGTEGPGFTDIICGIACANAARTPLLVVASNMALFQEDTEAGIQLAYQQPTTDGMKEYGKRLVTPSRVHEYTAYAFRQLRSGVPRPVHLGFPTEVAAARFKDASELETLSKYRLPVIVIVYNNNAWGTWTGAREPRALPLHLFQENVRYKVGEALGAHGEYVTTPGGFRPALERAWQVAVQESRPSVINCQGKKEFWLRETHPPGMLGKIEPGCRSYYH